MNNMIKKMLERKMNWVRLIKNNNMRYIYLTI